jgi:MinD superfamily P-loop ATPase
MIIAVASGKGGTGKTTVAVGLALSLAAGQQGVVGRETVDSTSPLLLDCDVEEPNVALLLRPAIEEHREVGQMIPEVDGGKCTYCGRCAEVCQYHAIAVAGKQVLVFPELCHACGSCALICPGGAITEVPHLIGILERGQAGATESGRGRLNVGEPMAVPVIRQLKQWVLPSDCSARPVILDAPPGTACPVVETMRGAHFVLMVTEPTPFGLHDLQLAVEVAREELGLPVGVVVNRDGVGDRGVDDYCAAESIPVLMRIPLDRRIAEAYAEGIPVVQAQPRYRKHFCQSHVAIREMTDGG